VATVSSSLLQFTFLFVALVGVTVAVRVSVPSTTRLVVDLFKDTPVTGTLRLSTVTLQVAIFLLITVVTMTVAVPTFLPVTTPSADTLATSYVTGDGDVFPSLLIHSTSLL